MTAATERRVQYPQLADGDWLRDAYVTRGLTPAEIQRLVGCGRSSVTAALARHKIEPRTVRYRKWTPTAAEIEGAYREHGTVLAAARACGVSDAWFRTKAGALGVDLGGAQASRRAGVVEAAREAVVDRKASRAARDAERRAATVRAARAALERGVPTRKLRELVPATGITLRVLQVRVDNPGVTGDECARIAGMTRGAYSAALSNALREPAK